MRTETFTDLSLPLSGDDSVRFVNARLSCNSLVPHKDQPPARVFVNRGWLWWIISKIFRQVRDDVITVRWLSSVDLLISFQNFNVRAKVVTNLDYTLFSHWRSLFVSKSSFVEITTTLDGYPRQ